jgi:hypothetical protein
MKKVKSVICFLSVSESTVYQTTFWGVHFNTFSYLHPMRQQERKHEEYARLSLGGRDRFSQERLLNPSFMFGLGTLDRT